jgi:hypothetical protein
MERVTMTEIELGKRWGVSAKTLQRWRSESRGPKYMKLSKRVLYPMDEIFAFETDAMYAGTSESVVDPAAPPNSKFLDVRQIAYATGLPLYVFAHKQVRESLGIPHRRISKQVRFVLDEVMDWAKRWSQDMNVLGADSRDSATPHRTLRQAIAALTA